MHASPEKNSVSAASLLKSYGVYFGLALLLVISAIVSPKSFNPSDLLTLAKQASALGIVGIGQTMIILTGGLDLSVGAVITFVHVFSVGTILGDPSLVLPVSVLCIGIGAMIGLLNGLGVTKARIPPLVMTLCTNFIVSGIYLIYTKGQPRGIVPENLRMLGRERIFGVLPVPVIIWIGIAVVFIFILRKTTFGARLYAVGANPRASFLSGVNNHRTLIIIYTLTGLLSAVAGILLTGDMGAVSLGLGTDYAMESIAATIIGGTSFVGGIGGIEGTIAGAYIIRLLTALLQKANIANSGKLISQGLLILLIVGLYSKQFGSRAHSLGGKKS